MSDPVPAPELGINQTLQFLTDAVPDAPLVFTIDGESFACRPWITGAAHIRYAKLMAAGGLSAVTILDDFFSDVMEDAEFERFNKFIEDPGRRVTAKLLGDIFLSLYLKYSAQEAPRPTEPSGPTA